VKHQNIAIAKWEKTFTTNFFGKKNKFRRKQTVTKGRQKKTVAWMSRKGSERINGERINGLKLTYPGTPSVLFF